MGYEQIGGAKVYRPWVGWTVGDSFEGILRGTSEDSYGKTNWEFETINADFEEETVTIIPKKGKNAGKEMEYGTPKEGQTFVLNSSGFLDAAMEKVDMGDKVKVIYEGTIILPSGPNKGSEAHTGKVFREAGKSSTSSKAAATSDDDVDDVL
jgi:uncharacterized membrane protein